MMTSYELEIIIYFYVKLISDIVIQSELWE